MVANPSVPEPFHNMDHGGVVKETDTERRRLPPFVFVATLAGIAACAAAAIGARGLPTALAATRWPTVSGTIVTAEIRNETMGLDGPRLRPIRVRSFYVTYAYSLNGRQFVGNRVGAEGPTGKSYPRRYAERYPVGRDVQVHVNPAEPTDAVLDAPLPIATSLGVLASLLFGILLLRWARRQQRAFDAGDPAALIATDADDNIEAPDSETIA